MIHIPHDLARCLFLGFCLVGLAIGIPLFFCIGPMARGLSGASDCCPPPPYLPPESK